MSLSKQEIAELASEIRRQNKEARAAQKAAPPARGRKVIGIYLDPEIYSAFKTLAHKTPKNGSLAIRVERFMSKQTKAAAARHNLKITRPKDT